MRSVEVLLPKWGLTMTEATVVQWLKSPGDTVEKQEPIVEVETEKANAEVEAPAAGIMGAILHEPGAVVDVGKPLAVLQVEGDAEVATSTADRAPADATRAEPVPADGATEPADREPQVAPVAARGPATDGPRPSRASPVARRVAAELGVELARVQGTGTRGLITEGDVRAAARTKPAETDATGGLQPASKVTLSGRRKAIGETLARNLATSPQVTLTRSADASGLAQIREVADANYSVNDLLIAATAAALVQHPALNAHLIDGELSLFDDVNIGLAVDIEGGLIVPVLRGADRLSLDAIRSERLRLVDGLRKGTTPPAELMDGTFTITNLGAWHVDGFTPIINPPQVAILGVGRIVDRPTIVDGSVVPRPQTVFSLTFDHRALDGRPAAEFLADLCELLASAQQLGALASIDEEP